MRRTPNATALTGGVVAIVLGVLLVLDAAGRISLQFAYAGPLLVAGAGAVILASGLSARARATARARAGEPFAAAPSLASPFGAPAAESTEEPC